MNKDAFNAAYLEWRDSIWLAERMKVADEVLSDKENESRFKQLKDRLNAGGMVPFVGAGLSIPSGGRRWAEFLHKLRVHCEPPISEVDLNEVIGKQGYEQAAELIITRTVPRLFDERFEDYCLYAEVSKLRGAVLFLPLLFDDHSLTTNFDNVEDIVYELSGKSFDNILKGREVTEWPKYAMQRKRMLLKIHGHGSLPDTRVLTKSEYDSAYAAGSPHMHAMDGIFRNSSLLFLGCSLATDRTMDLLKAIYTDTNAPDIRNYAILPMSDNEMKRRKRETFLAERGIFPIWYGRYDETNDPDFDHDLHVESILVKILNEQNRIGELTVEPDEPVRGSFNE